MPPVPAKPSQPALPDDAADYGHLDEPAKPAADADRELIKAIAMDIGKAVVHHIETMYPSMFDAVAGAAKLSVRNCVYNEIMAALEV
ncbi:MAG TPA: hypothetical protein VEB64_04860, partial [Azospirillaceae bacterium]|nr:hypothetical protein [Azospirillaceae bacterium]